MTSPRTFLTAGLPFLVAGLLALPACGSDDEQTDGGDGAMFLGACDTRTVSGLSEGQCRDFRGQPGPDLEVSCNGLDGAFSASTPCPASDRVGHCTLDPVIGVSAIYNFYLPVYTSATAQSTCTSLAGTFTQDSP